MQEFIQLASELADAAAEIVKKYYRTSFDIESKGDESPVTIADRAVEERIRNILAGRRPQDGIFGEEYGIKDGENGLSWVIDPIDGTKSFMIGRPTFGTLIALCEDGVPKLGVIDQAISGERWIGVSGAQTTLNGAPVKTRRCAGLDVATICSTTPAMFGDAPVYKAFNEGKFAWGGDCYMYGLLACGFLDMTLEASLKPYDFAALVPVVAGAGGVICDYEGRAITLASDGRVFALGDPALKNAVMERIAKS